MTDDHDTVDLLEKDREYNSNRAIIDSRRERDKWREAKQERRNTPTSELYPAAKAARYARKASLHLGERVTDTDILREMEFQKTRD